MDTIIAEILENDIISVNIIDTEEIKINVDDEIVNANLQAGVKGVGIKSIDKTDTEGLVDTYTVTFDDLTTSQFYVTNGQQEIVNSSTFVFTQIIASDDWFILHSLDCFPSVTVIDSAGSIVVGEVSYIDSNSISIKFIGSFSGSAYLN